MTSFSCGRLSEISRIRATRASSAIRLFPQLIQDIVLQPKRSHAVFQVKGFVGRHFRNEFHSVLGVVEQIDPVRQPHGGN